MMEGLADALHASTPETLLLSGHFSEHPAQSAAVPPITFLVLLHNALASVANQCHLAAKSIISALNTVLFSDSSLAKTSHSSAVHRSSAMAAIIAVFPRYCTSI
jgi:hypothetical protein